MRTFEYAYRILMFCRRRFANSEDLRKETDALTLFKMNQARSRLTNKIPNCLVQIHLPEKKKNQGTRVDLVDSKRGLYV